jgi:hypothetical protein
MHKISISAGDTEFRQTCITYVAARLAVHGRESAEELAHRYQTKYGLAGAELLERAEAMQGQDDGALRAHIRWLEKMRATERRDVA